MKEIIDATCSRIERAKTITKPDIGIFNKMLFTNTFWYYIFIYFLIRQRRITRLRSSVKLPSFRYYGTQCTDIRTGTTFLTYVVVVVVVVLPSLFNVVSLNPLLHIICDIYIAYIKRASL